MLLPVPRGPCPEGSSRKSAEGRTFKQPSGYGLQCPFRFWLWYNGAHFLAVLFNLSFSQAEPREAIHGTHRLWLGDILIQWPLIRDLILETGREA